MQKVRSRFNVLNCFYFLPTLREGRPRRSLTYRVDESETIYSLRVDLKKCRQDMKQAESVVDVMRRKLEEAQARILILEQENTRKHCIEERRDWKQLVAAVNSDRTRIQKENERLLKDNATLLDERNQARETVESLTRELQKFRPIDDDDEKNASTESSRVENHTVRDPAPYVSDLAKENRALREENRSLRSLSRKGGDNGELHVKTLLSLTSQKEELDMLRQENQDLKGRILHESAVSSGSSVLTDLISAFRFCSQPPKAKRVVET